MRITATLLIAVSTVTTAVAQTSSGVPAYSGQQYGQTQVQQHGAHSAAQGQQYQQVPRSGSSRGTYARSTYPPRATYSRSTYPPGYAPAGSQYAHPTNSYPYGQYPQNVYPSGHGHAYHVPQQHHVNPQAITSQPQVQQPQFGAGFGTTYADQTRQQASHALAGQPQVQQPQFGAGFGPAYSDQVQLAAQINARQQRAANELKNRERWRQYQLQQAQQQAYIQQYGTPAAQQFWQDIYGYNRSTYNQSRHGYSYQGQSRTGQNQYGYSSYNQSRSGQAFSHPGFHSQSRFNQSQPIYSFHNIVVPQVGHWRR